MEFTYTSNYGKIRYDKFSWLTGEYDPDNLYALDERGKKYEEYVANLKSHGIWFITGWTGDIHAMFIDNYGNAWAQEGVYERGHYLKRCPYKKKDYEHSTIQLPDQAILKIINKEWTIRLAHATSDIMRQFEAFKQDIEDERSGLKEYIDLLGGNDTQIKDFRKNIALLNNGELSYELIAPIATPSKPVPQSLLGNRHIIGNPRHYIVVDNTGQVWTLGTLQSIPFSTFEGGEVRYVGDTPIRHGERHIYPLPTILQTFVSDILSYTHPRNKWGCGGDTTQPSEYNMYHLQPVAMYLFNNYAPDNIKQEYLEAERLYEEEIIRKEENRKKTEEEARQKIIAEETFRIEESKRIKAEEEAAAEKKRIAEELKAKQIAQAQAELVEAQKRLNDLLSSTKSDQN